MPKKKTDKLPAVQIEEPHPPVLPFDPADIDELPEHLQMDETNPQNHDYNQRLVMIRREMAHLAMKMIPAHVQIVRLKHEGLKNVQIAEKVGYTPNSVSQILHRQDARAYSAILFNYKAAIDGPSAGLKQHLLYSIALENQQQDPRVSISAIAELNKMAGDYDKDDSANQPPQIVIHQHLGKGALDK